MNEIKVHGPNSNWLFRFFRKHKRVLIEIIKIILKIIDLLERISKD